MDSGLKYGLIMLTHAYTLKPRSKVVDDIPIEMHIDYRRMCVCVHIIIIIINIINIINIITNK